MHALLRSLALLAWAAAPAAAGTMLFATAATPGRIDGFCVGPNGALTATPRTQIDTAGSSPSVLIASPDGKVLMVAENDRVEFFSIGTDGRLSRPSGKTHIPKPPRKGINSRQIALSLDGNLLYIGERRQNRIVAWQLGSDYLPTSEYFASCALGPAGVDFETIVVRPGFSDFIYVTRAGGNGQLGTWPTDATGQIIGQCELGNGTVAACVGPGACDRTLGGTIGNCHTVLSMCPEVPIDPSDPDCDTTPYDPLICPLQPDPDCVACAGEEGCACQPAVAEPSSCTTRLVYGAGPFVIVPAGGDVPTPNGVDTIWVDARFDKRLRAFELNGATSTAPGTLLGTPKPADDDDAPNCKQKPIKVNGKNVVNQADIRYQEMILANRTLLGSQFIDGRIDAYRIRDDGTVPGQPTKTTRGNVRTTPVGLTARNDVLYVATGMWDRVQAYRLDKDGVIKDREPFSETEALRDSFPNALVLVDVPDACN